MYQQIYNKISFLKKMGKKKEISEVDEQQKTNVSKRGGSLKEKNYHKWKNYENQKYARFLLDNLTELNDSKNDKIPLYFFNRMAEAIRIGKKNSQCRSHHQKMLLKYGSLSAVIRSLLPEKEVDNEYSSTNSAKSEAFVSPAEQQEQEAIEEKRNNSIFKIELERAEDDSLDIEAWDEQKVQKFEWNLNSFFQP